MDLRDLPDSLKSAAHTALCVLADSRVPIVGLVQAVEVARGVRGVRGLRVLLVATPSHVTIVAVRHGAVRHHIPVLGAAPVEMRTDLSDEGGGRVLIRYGQRAALLHFLTTSALQELTHTIATAYRHSYSHRAPIVSRGAIDTAAAAIPAEVPLAFPAEYAATNVGLPAVVLPPSATRGLSALASSDEVQCARRSLEAAEEEITAAFQELSKAVRTGLAAAAAPLPELQDRLRDVQGRIRIEASRSRSLVEPLERELETARLELIQKEREHAAAVSGTHGELSQWHALAEDSRHIEVQRERASKELIAQNLAQHEERLAERHSLLALAAQLQTAIAGFHDDHYTAQARNRDELLQAVQAKTAAVAALQTRVAQETQSRQRADAEYASAVAALERTIRRSMDNVAQHAAEARALELAAHGPGGGAMTHQQAVQSELQRRKREAETLRDSLAASVAALSAANDAAEVSLGLRGDSSLSASASLCSPRPTTIVRGNTSRWDLSHLSRSRRGSVRGAVPSPTSRHDPQCMPSELVTSPTPPRSMFIVERAKAAASAAGRVEAEAAATGWR